MLLRGFRRPPGDPAFPSPPPGSPRGRGPRVAPPPPEFAGASGVPPFPEPGVRAGGRLPEAAGGGEGSARRAVPPGLRRVVQAKPSSPARFRPPRASTRTHAAVVRPFPLPVHVPRARASVRAPRVSLPAPRTPPLRVPRVALPVPRRAPALACAALRAPVGLCACAVFPAARTLPSPPSSSPPPPARRGPRRGPETPPSCPEGRGPSSAPAGRPAPPRLPTKDGRAPEPGAGEGPVRPPLFPPAGRPGPAVPRAGADGGDRACPRRRELFSEVRFLVLGEKCQDLRKMKFASKCDFHPACPGDRLSYPRGRGGGATSIKV